MKVGDTVTRIHNTDSPRWKVTNIKSDARAFWIQLDVDRNMADVWHDASYFDVFDESLENETKK